MKVRVIVEKPHSDRSYNIDLFDPQITTRANYGISSISTQNYSVEITKHGLISLYRKSDDEKNPFLIGSNFYIEFFEEEY